MGRSLQSTLAYIFDHIKYYIFWISINKWFDLVLSVRLSVGDLYYIDYIILYFIILYYIIWNLAHMHSYCLMLQTARNKLYRNDLSYSYHTNYRLISFICQDMATKLNTSDCFFMYNIRGKFQQNRSTLIYSCHRNNRLKLRFLYEDQFWLKK